MKLVDYREIFEAYEDGKKIIRRAKSNGRKSIISKKTHPKEFFSFFKYEYQVKNK